MLDSPYEQQPQAGDIERQPGLETLYLAPRPVPTGQAAISAQQMHREINSTYLDFAQGTGRIEFGVRVTMGTLIAGLVFFFTCTVFLGWVDYVDRGSSIWDFVLKFFFMNRYMWLFMLFFATVFGGIFTYAVYQETRHPPIRFNRQRREVCYIPAKGKPAFIPWEELIACVSAEQTITQYAANSHFALRLGFRDTQEGQMYWLTVPSPSLMFAISEWEALRVFMEQGLDALPPPPPAEYEEGSLAYFLAASEIYREELGFIRYRSWWLLQCFTGWTIPCHVAEWFSHLPKAGFPKAVREWSQPLPAEQWAKPSAELLKQSAELQAAYARGLDFMQYFEASFSGSPENTPANILPSRKGRNG
ncbi:hypothetical protein V0R48_05040 [Pseudomonas alcaligenes]|jgi:hypothetical protein|uniref:hypothetical protein n=1 Tax=Aquipseudomonas alcaligenes TaxID=43263 RepID=UPI002E7AE635|nr:hypothetical protein [Pseudomonas alcaligenes]MEE1948330.1 hypothetical protein [Pseudomonas alcaligenes]